MSYKNVFTSNHLRGLGVIMRTGPHKVGIASSAKTPRTAKNGSLYYKVHLKAISVDSFGPITQSLKVHGDHLNYQGVKDNFLMSICVFEDNPCFDMFPLYKGDIVEAIMEEGDTKDSFKCTHIKSVPHSTIPDSIEPEAVTELGQRLALLVEKTIVTNT